MTPRRLVAGLVLLLTTAPTPALAGEPGPRFLAEPPDRAVHHHTNRITLDHRALTTGWADLHQCHTNMDALGRTQIVFRKGRIRNIKVMSTTNIEKARVEGPSVQLDGVREGAEICLRAETRNLRRPREGTVTVRSGPFMRRLFDSYFPLHVTLIVVFPPERLSFRAIEPPPQPGLALRQEPDRVTMEAWFAGKLRTRVRFAVVGRPVPDLSPPGDG